ncbi:MAG TPA: response regulator transcription factor [Nitrospiria bacterium]|nr:response regulator transcription factor [Nitrospiria bacterium]
MTQTILIIEDEPVVSDVIASVLVNEGYQATLAKNGVEALKKISQNPPDLVLLDLKLPDMEGSEVLKSIRKSKKTHDIPTMIITGKGDLSDRLEGFEQGADDVLTKPFEPKELLARMRAIFRRHQAKPKQESRQTQYGERLRLDADKHEAWYDGKEVWLTPKEFSLLEFLIKNQGKVQTRPVLLKEIWGQTSQDPTRTVDVHIRRLRSKIPMLETELITIKPMGYKLRELFPS